MALLSNPVRAAAGFFCCLAVFLGGAGGASAQSSAPPLNSLDQIGGHIAQCWHVPQDSPGIVEVTVRLRFSRKGAVIGEPRTAYIRAGSGAGLKERITSSILAAIKACTPLNFTPALGVAISGRMLAIRFRSLPLSGHQREV